ncbi:MAG: hypothetical protein AAFY39_09005, partial [Pseudomonadota bacterium]
MKPKTVGRVSDGETPATRTSISHVGLVAGAIVLTADGEIPVEYLSTDVSFTMPALRVMMRSPG